MTIFSCKHSPRKVLFCWIFQRLCLTTSPTLFECWQIRVLIYISLFSQSSIDCLGTRDSINCPLSASPFIRQASRHRLTISRRRKSSTSIINQRLKRNPMLSSSSLYLSHVHNSRLWISVLLTYVVPLYTITLMYHKYITRIRPNKTET